MIGCIHPMYIRGRRINDCPMKIEDKEVQGVDTFIGRALSVVISICNDESFWKTAYYG